MFLYTLRSYESPLHIVVHGHFLDENLALEAADAILPLCVGPVKVEKWPIATGSPIVDPERIGLFITGVECEIIYKKEGTRKLNESQRAAFLSYCL